MKIEIIFAQSEKLKEVVHEEIHQMQAIDLQKEIKVTRNGKYVSIYKKVFCFSPINYFK